MIKLTMVWGLVESVKICFNKFNIDNNYQQFNVITSLGANINTKTISFTSIEYIELEM